MMKNTLFFWLIFLNCFSVFSQAPNLQWQKCYGGTDHDPGNYIEQTNDGGYIMIGNAGAASGDITLNRGETDIWIIKTNASGTIVWQKTYGGSGFENGNAVHQMTDGGYVIFGSTYSNDGDVVSNHGNCDFWIIKIDSVGNIVWQKTYGGSYSDLLSYGHQTSDGGFILVGHTFSFNGDLTNNNTDGNVWLLKTNASGTIEWQKTYGGSAMDDGKYVQQTTDGGYIISGRVDSTDGIVTNHHGSVDCWLIKTDATGTVQWNKVYGGSAADYNDNVVQTSDGGYVVSGYTFSTDFDVTGNHGLSDCWVFKVNPTGDIVWKKTYGGTIYESRGNLKKTVDEGFVVLGSTQSNDGDVLGNHGPNDFWLFKLNSVGDLVWQKPLGGSSNDLASCVQVTSDNGYVVAGITYSNNGNVSGNHGGSDFWLAKLSPDTTLDTRFLQDNNALLVYPNPTKEVINLQIKEDSVIDTIRITDVSGKNVLQQYGNSFKESNLTIDVKSFSNGIYFIELVSENKVYKSKFIKN